EHIERWRLHEYCERFVGKFAFEVQSSLYVNVENDMLAQCPDPIDFRPECPIKCARINLFKFDKFFLCDAVQKLLLGNKIIVFPVYFAFPRWPCTCGNGKCYSITVFG